MERDLYFVAYDVCDQRRLHQAHKVVVSYATGGQKSAYECFLTEAERERLVDELSEALDLAKDRAHLVRLRRNCRVTCLGKAVPPQDPDFFFVGG
ncbi:CRISPR-associated endonuclease Cas2 [Deferrisoma camini]|uniref:CRISPR-associated endonuclease Cas2 n=1 Tax=Deferrisoma camini TaxID=1035120 RepID=UPI00046D23EB|nr:CRISPR-associated endonuclease Cas2 [Deferrisoma camini]